MKDFALALGLLMICLGFGAHIATDPVTAEEIDYARWETCVKESDGSDASCCECDAKYNPNGYDFRIQD